MWTVSLRYFKFVETVGRFQRQLVLKETRVFKAQSSRDNLPWGNFPGGNFCGICQGPIFQREFFRGTVIPQGAIIQWEIFRGREGSNFPGGNFPGENLLGVIFRLPQHLQIHRRIQNSAKHLKWSKKERPAKIIIAWNFFPKILSYV